MFEAEKDKYLMKHGFGATRLKAVLFDMDGVLFDSMPNHAYSWSHAMTQFGLHITPEEAYMHEDVRAAEPSTCWHNVIGDAGLPKRRSKPSIKPSPMCSAVVRKPHGCRALTSC